MMDCVVTAGRALARELGSWVMDELLKPNISSSEKSIGSNPTKLGVRGRLSVKSNISLLEYVAGDEGSFVQA